MPFARSATDRLIAGVAGGIAARLNVEAVVIRLAFVVLALAGGAGVILYLAAWLAGAEDDRTDERAPARGRSGSETKQVVAIAAVVTGLLLLLREAGLWYGDELMWSVGLAAFGSAILWTRSDEVGRARFTRFATRMPRSPADMLASRSKGRLAVGALLVVGGMVTVLVAHASLAALRTVAVAVGVTVVGLALILGPWAQELVFQLRAERRERIRSEERAEVAAHLHDSVLQTLAMIQRSSSPQEMTSLARRQERELRAWLWGRATTDASGSQMLSAALEEMAARVEGDHHVPVETVTVGDAPVDARLRALVDAAREATTNAARHAGAKVISVYAEVESQAITVYVRDEGRGFDPSALPEDRRGVTDSIVARMMRNGGTAEVRSAPGEGTEVHLTMPRAGT